VDSLSIPPINFYQCGNNPELLILSGIHGDEFHILPYVKAVVEELEVKLPDFVFVPEVSPSAVKLKTRLNGYGNDINRHFGALQDPEAVALRELLSKHTFRTRISFHEDLEFHQEFYIYDSASLPQSDLERIRAQVSALGVTLRNGPDEEGLDFDVVDGYIENAAQKYGTSLFIEDWVPEGAKIPRSFTFEIPNIEDKISDLVRLCINFVVELGGT